MQVPQTTFLHPARDAERSLHALDLEKSEPGGKA